MLVIAEIAEGDHQGNWSPIAEYPAERIEDLTPAECAEIQRALLVFRQIKLRNSERRLIWASTRREEAGDVPEERLPGARVEGEGEKS